jgi:hypothetical protein
MMIASQEHIQSAPMIEYLAPSLSNLGRDLVTACLGEGGGGYPRLALLNVREGVGCRVEGGGGCRVESRG